MAAIRGVLFDYGLVLSGPPDPEAWDRLKELLSSQEEAFHAAYWRPRHEYDRGTLDSASYWAQVATELNESLTPGMLHGLTSVDVDVWTRPNREMIAWATQLQKQGIRTAILSNLGDAMEIGVRERCAWLADFHHLTFSHNLKMAKPEPSIYLHATEGMGLAPAEILFVDDREDNIAAAHALGLQAIQYTDHDAFVAELTALNAGLPLPALLSGD